MTQQGSAGNTASNVDGHSVATSQGIDNIDNDDAPVGRILSRREVLALLGLTGASALAAACQPMTAAQTPAAAAAAGAGAGIALPTVTPAPPVSTEQATVAADVAADVAAVEAIDTVVAPTCVARPELTEGPYFVDVQLNRSDIRMDANTGVVKEGAPLALTFRISQIDANACTPLAGAVVDIWHCDALGVYSGVTDSSFDTTSENWLRGYQVTNEQGAATFTTIYPGWYSGRTIHIHFKVRTDPDSAQGYDFTSQLFFDEALSDQVLAQEPYAAKGYRDTLNSQDGIYDDLLLLTVTPADQGYAATFDLGLDLS